MYSGYILAKLKYEECKRGVSRHVVVWPNSDLNVEGLGNKPRDGKSKMKEDKYA